MRLGAIAIYARGRGGASEAPPSLRGRVKPGKEDFRIYGHVYHGFKL